MMSDFDKQVIWQAELRAKQLDRGAQRAQAHGWPVKAAKLRHSANFAYRMAQDAREAVDHREDTSCQRFPV